MDSSQVSPENLPTFLEPHRWLLDPRLEVCVVGSRALFEGCRRAGLPLPPEPVDLDLSWRLEPKKGREFLTDLGLEVTATQGNEDRGTLAIQLSGHRVELTSYRGGGAETAERVAKDGALRDMTIGAVYWKLWCDKIADPMDGLADWGGGLVRACGLSADRIQEHPIRALRYLRKTIELGFHLDTATRRGIEAQASFVGKAVLPEALAEEIRKVLARCTSPGAFFQLAWEVRLLDRILPEIAPLFDGRPAGRILYHPEISQALHMILAMSAAVDVASTEGLDLRERHLLLMAVLCHDLGKGSTQSSQLPSHPGHEAGGVGIIHSLFRRLPGLGNKYVERFCKVSARSHLLLNKLPMMRAGTLVDLWEQEFRGLESDYRNLARVVRCDRDGRLRPAQIGIPCPEQIQAAPAGQALEDRIHADLSTLDTCIRSVSGEASARLHPGDPQALKEHLRTARCKALAHSGFLDIKGRKQEGHP